MQNRFFTGSLYCPVDEVSETQNGYKSYYCSTVLKKHFSASKNISISVAFCMFFTRTSHFNEITFEILCHKQFNGYRVQPVHKEGESQKADYSVFVTTPSLEEKKNPPVLNSLNLRFKHISTYLFPE